MIPFVLRHMDRRVASGHASDSTAPAPVPWQVTARALLPVFATVFMLSFLAQGLFSSTVTYWIEKQQINELLLPGGLILGAATWAAALYLLRGALDPWIAPQIGAFSDKKNRRQTLLVGTAIAAGVLYLLIPQELPPWLWLFVLLLILISATMLNTLQEALFIDQTAHFAHAKHSLISAYSMCSDVGAAAGPIVAYLLITFVHGESVLWLIAALLWSAALIWHRSRPSLHVPFHA
jgi:MFS family permease